MSPSEILPYRNILRQAIQKIYSRKLNLQQFYTSGLPQGRELLGAQVLNSFMYIHRSKAGQTVGFGACAGVHIDSDGGKRLFVPVTTGKQIAFYPD